MVIKTYTAVFFLVVLLGLSAGCGGGDDGTSPFTVGGTVSGLSGAVVLQNNSGDDLLISAAGTFTFVTQLADGATYEVTVQTQPSGQECSVSSGTGTVRGANVTTVVVTCLNRPTIFSVGPADASPNVSPTSSVSVTFSEEMNHASTEGALSLSSGETPVSGAFSWSGYTMKFTPTSSLTNSAHYTLSVSTDATNSAGAHLAVAQSSSFTVGDSTVTSSITNMIDDIATSELLDWTKGFGAGCFQDGIQIISTGTSCTYYRSDLDIGNAKSFQIEAVLSADALVGDGERGARLWASFYKSGTSGPAYYVELQLWVDGGVQQLRLADYNGGDFLFLAKDWANAEPRLRVRIKRQLINGIDYIFLQAENSHSWDDPTDPNNLDNANSIGSPLSNFQTALGNPIWLGFGNAVADNYSSAWESVHITIGEDSSTILPYWPPLPPTPILIFDDKGVGVSQGMNFSSYDSSEGYLANDTITSHLNADGTTYIGATETNPQDEYWNFTGLGASQTVTGYVTVEEVSGRSRTSSSGSVSIPSR